MDMSQPDYSTSDRFDIIVTALAQAEQPYQAVQRLLFPARYASGEHAQPPVAAQVKFETLAADDQLKMINGPRHDMSLGEIYGHHMANSGMWMHYPTCVKAQEFNGRRGQFIIDPALSRIFTINAYMTHEDATSDNKLQSLPYQHEITAYNVLGVILQEAQKTGEYEQVEKPIQAYREQLLNFVNAEEEFLASLIVDKNQPEDMTASLYLYGRQVIPQ